MVPLRISTGCPSMLFSFLFQRNVCLCLKKKKIINNYKRGVINFSIKKIKKNALYLCRSAVRRRTGNMCRWDVWTFVPAKISRDRKLSGQDNIRDRCEWIAQGRLVFGLSRWSDDRRAPDSSAWPPWTNSTSEDIFVGFLKNRLIRKITHPLTTQTEKTMHDQC